MFRAIKLTDIDGGPLLVLVHQITSVGVLDDETTVFLRDESSVTVTESVDQILKLINNP